MKTFLDLCRERRSVRAYTDEAVNEADLAYVMECVRLAPSAVNCQPWRFRLIDKPADLKALRACYDRSWFASVAACFVVTCKTSEQWMRPADGKGHGGLDVAIATEHLCLAAAERGLGTCWVCNFDVKRCSELLALPADETPMVLVPIGHPADSASEKKRKPLEEIFIVQARHEEI